MKGCYNMDILHELFWAYREGKLTIKPPAASEAEGSGIDSIEERYQMNTSQANEFENIIYGIYSRIEEEGFCAGFKIALNLIAG